MSRNLFISYDLYNPRQNHAAIGEKIKSLGSWAKVYQPVWYLSTNQRCQETAKQIHTAMDSNDSLIVIDVSSNDAYWYNLKLEVGEHIQRSWNTAIRT